MLKAKRGLEYWQGLFEGLRKQEKSLSQMSRAGTLKTVHIVFGIMSMVCIASDAKAALSDREVTDLINKDYYTCHSLKIGKRALGDRDMNSQYITQKELDFLRAASRAGLVILEEGSETALTQKLLTGIIKQINVVPTAAGLQARMNCQSNNPGLLRIKTYAVTVDKIISNEEVKTAVDTFRIVKGIGTRRLSDTGVAFYQQWVKDSARAFPPQALKFIKLLKYDPFTKGWIVVATDDALINSPDIKTDKVQRYLTGKGATPR